MDGFTVAFDAARGLVVFRINLYFHERNVSALIKQLSDTVAQARASGPLRLLWDNRVGRQIPPSVTEVVRKLLAGAADDRVAVIVPNSLAKVQARPSMDQNSQLFASENAAIIWLSVGTSVAA